MIDFQQSREVNERFFLPHFAFPGYAPRTIAVNVTRFKEDSMLVKRLAVYIHLS